jgi:hypothetical protein
LGVGALSVSSAFALQPFDHGPFSLGDTQEFRYRHRQNKVSIGTRHECRAIQATFLPTRKLTEVSIRARHECRAIPVRAWDFCFEAMRFNPHPARVPGDT